MAYQDDKYENFMPAVLANRTAAAKFADFTVSAVTASGVDAFIGQHAAALVTARDHFRRELAERIQASGVSQSGTKTEEEAFTDFKAFIQNTEADMLRSWLRRHTNLEDTFYPEGLSALTQAPKKHRLTRLTAYTQALEQYNDDLPDVPPPPGAPASEKAKRPGPAARALLVAYINASTKKTGSRTALRNEREDVTPAGTILAECLWDVHCAALYHHRRRPAEARKYFDYPGLPHRITKGSTGKATSKKGTSAAA